MTSAESEDIDLRLGLLDSERDVVRELWFRPVALDVFQRWISGCEAVRRLRPRDVLSADFTTSTLRGTLGTRGNEWVLSVFAHDAGLLHEIAEHALADGVGSVVVDGEGFTGEAPFFAVTERVPGRQTKTLWFDPLRGLTSDSAEIDSVLTRSKLSLDAMIRSRYVSAIEELIGWVKWIDEGRVLSTPEWRPVAGPTSSGWGWFVVLSLLALLVPTFFASMANGIEFGPVLFSVIFVSWMAFIPLRVPLLFRAAWFVVVPALWSLLVMFSRSR